VKISTKIIVSLLVAFALIFGLLIWPANQYSQIVLAQSALDENESANAINNESQTTNLNQDKAISPPELPYKYWGNNFSHKFHRPSCPFGRAISKRHLVLFHFRHEAIEAHYAPCRYCLPPIWLTVHGVLLPKQTEDSHSTGTTTDSHRQEENDNDH